MNKKIVSIIRPFSLIQEIHIYDNGMEVDEINTSLTDFNNTIFNIVNTENHNYNTNVMSMYLKWDTNVSF